ncbi:sugar transferase [Arthrobacter sp. GCM10027362]|uniref:sugar transferase n=1 Tax=Arthrobacter sp. GCM10027362 TaxID=3273379 RepID=UPI003639FF99
MSNLGGTVSVDAPVRAAAGAGVREVDSAAAGTPSSAVLWSRRYRTRLWVSDVLIIGMAVGWLELARAGGAGSAWNQAVVALGVALAWIASLAAFRTRDTKLIGIGAAEYKAVIIASAAVFGSLAFVFLTIGQHNVKEYFLFVFPAGTLALVAGRWAWRCWLNNQRKYGHYLSRVVVLGQRQEVEYVSAQIHKNCGAAYQVVGAVLDRAEADGSLSVGGRTIPVISDPDDVVPAVARVGADAVIVAGQLPRDGKYLRELSWQLEASSTQLVMASSLTNVAGPRIQVRPVEGLPLMHVEQPTFAGGKHFVKRAMDIACASLGLLAFAPLLAVLAVLIKLDSRGPVFFRQQRVGKDGRMFNMYKLRSMVVDAEEQRAALKSLDEGNGVLFVIRNDPRVTKVGRWIRKHSLDELPQLFNVVRGDMSLVGPRPPLASEVAVYEGFTHRRLKIKPGCTGLWQINGRDDLSWEESVRLDLYYVENWSVTGDLVIMWRTLKVMLKPVGAH